MFDPNASLDEHYKYLALEGEVLAMCKVCKLGWVFKVEEVIRMRLDLFGHLHTHANERQEASA